MTKLPDDPPRHKPPIPEWVWDAIDERDALDGLGLRYDRGDRDWTNDLLRSRLDPEALRAAGKPTEPPDGGAESRAALRPEKRASEALPRSLAPRGLNRKQAAAYVGVGAGTFDAMVRAGTMPPATRMPGHRRDVWDRHALDAALTRLSGHAPPEAPPPIALDEPNPWDEVLQ